MTKKTVFISDFHLTDEASYAAKPYPYNKISLPQIQNTTNFLTYIVQRPKEFERVVLLGDILDLWTVPYSLPPSSMDAVITAKQNAPIVKVLGLLPKAGIEVVYVAGNHDDRVVRSFIDGMKVVNEYRNGTILGCHGHENCLFNGPDPKGRNSFGYYITRVAAGVTLKTGKSFPSEAAMLIKNRDQLLKIPRQGLTTTIWNVVTDEASMQGGDVFNGVTGSPKTVDAVRSDYASLYFDRHGNADQIAAEFDPYYSMFGGNARLCVCGHSHTHVFSSLSDHYMLYINVGAWCYESESYFGVTWTDDAGVWGALYRWTGNSVRKVNAGCVPK